MADPVLGPVAVNDVYRVSFLQRLYGQRVLNVLHYRVSEIDTPPAPDKWAFMGSLADSMTGAGSIQALMLPIQSFDLHHEEIRVNLVKLPNQATDPYFSLAAVEIGTDLAPAGTANVALSIEKRSTFDVGFPQQGIGRFQLGGIPNNSYEAGLFKAAYLTDALPLANEIAEEISTAGVTVIPVLYGLTDPLTGHSHRIFGTNLKTTVRDMRRRTVGKGE